MESAGLAAGIVSRLERRLDRSRAHNRDVEELFEQLTATLIAERLSHPEDALRLACRVLRISSAWVVRQVQARPVHLAGELALTDLHRSLQALGNAARNHVELLIDTWTTTHSVPRSAVVDVIIGAVCEDTLGALDASLFLTLHNIRNNPELQLIPKRSGGPEDAGVREMKLFLAQVRSKRGDASGAFDLIDEEPLADARVALTYAAIAKEHSLPDEAVDRLRRSLNLNAGRPLVWEWVAEVQLMAGALDEATNTLLQLLEDTGDMAYWEVLCDLLGQASPGKLDELRSRLAEDRPALHIEILMADNRVAEVLEASNGKSFTYEQLWRIGDYLASKGSRKAARVYERAIVLHGTLAKSRTVCTRLGDRLEEVVPYFASIERPTKPLRLAKELLARQRNNIPLRRELERVFGDALH